MPTLRPYQQDAANAIRQAAADGCRRVLFVGVTAFGKTNLFSHLAGEALRKRRSTWCLVHRWTLFDNTSATLTSWGVPHGLFDADHPHDGQPVQVVMKDTLAARLKKGWRPTIQPDVLIMDEADLVESSTWQAAIQAFPDAFVLGFTGTPERADGKGLGNTFQKMILGPSPRWMMDNGFIARPRYMPFALGEQVGIQGMTTNEEIAAALEDAKPRIVGDTVSHYLTHGKGLPFLGSAINIAHCERFVEAWQKEGIKCEVIHSELPDRLQAALFSDLKNKVIKGLWSVDMMGRGVDVPSIKYLCCARPTNSLPWWLQLLGRTIRVDGNVRPIVADHVGNLWRHGTVEMHREYSLEGKTRKERQKELEAALTQCPACFSFHERTTTRCCPECGHVPDAKERKLVARKGELKELEAAEIEAVARQKREEQGKAKSLDDLIALGKQRGMKDPDAWAVRVINARAANRRKAKRKL